MMKILSNYQLFLPQLKPSPTIDSLCYPQINNIDGLKALEGPLKSLAAAQPLKKREKNTYWHSSKQTENVEKKLSTFAAGGLGQVDVIVIYQHRCSLA